MENVPPVDMGVDLNQCDRPASFECPKNRYRNSVITSEDNGQCTGGEDFAHRLFRSVMVSSYVLGFGNDVSTIDNFDVAPVKQGTANIEIITIKPT